MPVAIVDGITLFDSITIIDWLRANRAGAAALTPSRAAASAHGSSVRSACGKRARNAASMAWHAGSLGMIANFLRPVVSWIRNSPSGLPIGAGGSSRTANARMSASATRRVATPCL